MQSKQSAKRQRVKQAIKSLPISQSTLKTACSSLSAHPSATPLSFSQILLLSLVNQVGTADQPLAVLMAENKHELSMLERIYEEKEFAGMERGVLLESCRELKARIWSLDTRVDGLMDEIKAKNVEVAALKMDLDTRVEYEQELIRKRVERLSEQKERDVRLIKLVGKFVAGDPFKNIKERWVNDASATACKTESCSVVFGVISRKHHCRRYFTAPCLIRV
jgi:hypothetical protein